MTRKILKIISSHEFCVYKYFVLSNLIAIYHSSCRNRKKVPEFFVQPTEDTVKINFLNQNNMFD